MKSLQDSKKVLIVTAATPTFDQYAAVFSIASSLKEFSAKEIHIGVAGNLSGKFKNTLNLGDIKILQKLPPKKFLLEFKDQKNSVKNIQWNQEGDAVKFFVTMDKGNFNKSQPNIKTLGSDYETVIFVGINNVMEMGQIYSESKEVFEEANVISIGGQVKDQGLKIKHEYDDKHLSVCEDTYHFLNKNNFKISKKAANALLAGIFFSTKNFKKNLNDAKTFITSADLLRSGATNQEAQGIVDQIRSGDSSKKQKSEQSSGSSSDKSKQDNKSGGQNPSFKPMQNTEQSPSQTNQASPERIRF